ncbi:MAG: ABC transporter permease, partial [Acidobacteriota bacterium]
SALLVLFALLPMRAGRGTLRDTLAAGSRSAGDLGGERARGWLVAGQIALSMVLLIAAGLMGRSLAHLWTLDPGLRTEGVLTTMLPFAGTPQAEEAAQQPFLDRLADEIGALPGVEHAALINHLHLGGDLWGYTFEIDGRPVESPSSAPNASQRVVDAGLFDALDIELLAGRGFDRRDHREAERVVVVNQTLAEQQWPDGTAVGQRLRGLGEDAPWRTVIGVVEDVRQWSLTDPIRPEIYFPYSQNPNPWWHHTSLVVTTSRPDGNAASLLPAVEARLAELAPGVPAARPRTHDQITTKLLWQPRFSATLLALFGVSAIGLALVGVYGTMAYSVVLRRPELGVRVALGADRGKLLALLLGRGLRTTLLGLAAGAVAALGLGRLLASQLYGVTVHDPLVWGLTAATVAGAAMLAVYLPARRAARDEMIDVLRS